MHLRKALTLGAAVLTAGVLSLTPSTHANNPTGGPPAFIGVNGATGAGNVPINGIYKGGTVTYGGGTFGCVGGTISGTVRRGAYALTPDMSFPNLSLTCATPLGVNGTISMKPTCVALGNFPDGPNFNVHDGNVDSGIGLKFNRVDGWLTIDPNCSARLSAFNGMCTADVSGTVDAFWDEALKVVSGVSYQDMILNGPGLTFANQTAGCLGLLAGGITLNNLVFNIQVTGGTVQGIDFRLTP